MKTFGYNKTELDSECGIVLCIWYGKLKLKADSAWTRSLIMSVARFLLQTDLLAGEVNYVSLHIRTY